MHVFSVIQRGRPALLNLCVLVISAKNLSQIPVPNISSQNPKWKAEHTHLENRSVSAVIQLDIAGR